MNILESVFSVFTKVGEWIVDSVNAMSALFYNPETGLTLIGVLSVSGLAFSVVFLIIHVIARFLHFRS